MPPICILYYITDCSAFPGDEPARRRALLEKIGEAARAGIDYIQLREKDLSSRDLASLAQDAVAVLQVARSENPERKTKLLINSRTDIALATGMAELDDEATVVVVDALAQATPERDADLGLVHGRRRLPGPYHLRQATPALVDPLRDVTQECLQRLSSDAMTDDTVPEGPEAAERGLIGEDEVQVCRPPLRGDDRGDGTGCP